VIGIRPALTAAAALLLASGVSQDRAAGLFDTKLTPDQEVVQALNRLTFGARPGDVEEVRKIGVAKWIELQLHPDQISENPVLDTKLKPLESLDMKPPEILQEYYQQNQMGMMRMGNMQDLMTQEQRRRIYNGTAEERKSALLTLDADKRWQVLAMLPQNVLEGLPDDLQEETKIARQKQQEERQKEQRKMHPPLQDLLTPAEAQIALRGTKEDREALYNAMDSTKRQQVAWALSPAALADFPAMRRMGTVARTPRQVVVHDLREARVYRALYSNRQLEEVLTDFWFNHFNVFENKGQPEQLVLASYENEAIRPHVLGHFKDLLLATARHPAMLYYLDNWTSMGGNFFNVGPFSQDGQFPNNNFLSRQPHGLNENYGRELMELHTLGVNGGYTQDDVINVARCFTGWTIQTPNTKPEFTFASFMHDDAEKTVLGHKIAAGGGEQDGLQVIDILAHHPSTAHFLSQKLAQRFVADSPPAELVDRMAKTFLKTDGDLRAVLETMFTSREFLSQGAWENKIKSPLEMVTSAVRATGAEAADTYVLAQRITDMGEPLYGRVEPSGFKEDSDTWLSTANLMARINFAVALGAGQVPGVKLDTARFADKDTAYIAHDLLHRDPSPQTLAAIEKGNEDKPATPGATVGLVISSPEFQRR
jgi:uncharacterized protein (DUF1800 family)